MSSNALKILALITLLLALVLGYVAYRMSENLTAQPTAQAIETNESKQLAYTMAAVTVKPIRAHQQIESDDVELVPVSVLPASYFESKDDVIGKSPLVDIDTGTTLTPRLFRESNVLSKSIPDAHRAMSLEIDDVIAVGGFVQPGDIVDALIFIKSKGKEVNDSQARLLLEKTLVLAYDERILSEVEGVENADSESKRQSKRRQRTVVLAVPEKDTARVALGASIGDIRLALHGSTLNSDDDATENEQDIPTGKTPAAVNSASATDKNADDKYSIKPITLSELGEISKKNKSKARYVPPPVYVYRGNDVEAVR